MVSCVAVMIMHSHTINADVSEVTGCEDVPNPVLRRKNVPSGPFAWRMKTHGCPEEPNMHHARTIHRQCLDGCPSHDRFAKGVSAIVTIPVTNAPHSSRVTDVLSKGYEDFPERVSSPVMSRVFRS